MNLGTWYGVGHWGAIDLGHSSDLDGLVAPAQGRVPNDPPD